MPRRSGRTPEHEIATAIIRIAATKPGNYATLDELRLEMPGHIDLSPEDLEYSTRRPGEQMWEQSLRNVQSHHANRTNFINRGLLDHIPGGGYAATDAGIAFLEGIEDDD